MISLSIITQFLSLFHESLLITIISRQSWRCLSIKIEQGNHYWLQRVFSCFNCLNLDHSAFFSGNQIFCHYIYLSNQSISPSLLHILKNTTTINQNQILTSSFSKQITLYGIQIPSRRFTKDIDRETYFKCKADGISAQCCSEASKF